MKLRLGICALALLAVMPLPGCADAGGDAETTVGSSEANIQENTLNPSPDPSEQNANTSEGTPLSITFGDTELTARLYDNASARDLTSRLPLTLTFSDFNGVEKLSPLSSGLSLDGVPEGDDPAVGDIGYYSPSGDLVFYYGDVGYYDGIVRIGEFEGDVDSIERQSGDFDVTIERA